MEALVYHNGALGDFLTTLPAIQKYRSVIKSDQLTLLSKKHFGELAVSAGYSDSFIDINRYSFLFNAASPYERVESFFNQFTHCLLFTNRDSPILINALRQNNLRVLYQPPFPSEEIPVIDYHLSLFKDSNSNSAQVFTSLNSLFIEPPHLSSDRIKNKTVALAPGSGSKLKNWPLKRFRIISDYLTEKGFDVCWFAGECETNFQFRDSDKVIREMDLITLSRFLHTCTLYIGNDSGITHLAAASHCPVIAIFGASNPGIWAPRGSERISCLFKSSCQNYCQTCKKVYTCKNECIKSVQIEDVIAEITRILS